MAKPTVLTPPAWVGTWPGVVTAVKVETLPFYDTTYEVFLDGTSVGYVVSRQDRGHATLWGAGSSLDERFVAGMTSRAMAADVLVSTAVTK